MPELPEVETARSWIANTLTGQAVTRVQLASVSALKTVTPSLFSLDGRRVTGARRRGKWLILETDGPRLCIHLGRGGWLHWRTRATSTALSLSGPLALRLSFAQGSLDITEHGREHRLQLHVVDDGMLPTAIEGLGPDALAVTDTPGILGDLLHAAGRSPLKTMLTDQHLIAGIGNAYSDEILHHAHLSPFRPAAGAAGEAAVLATALRDVLGGAVAALAGSDLDMVKTRKRSGFSVHDRAGMACPRCGDVVRRVDLGSRSVEYCPRCQTGGRHHADRRLSRLLR